MTSLRYVREYLVVSLRGLLWLPQTWLLIGWLWMRQEAVHRRAVKALKKALARPPAGPDPLREWSPGLYEVQPHRLHAASDPEPAPLAPDALTVLHLLGTGECIYSPLPGLRTLCEMEPRLRQVRHVIVDTPQQAASYLGPQQFAARLRRTIEPELARQRDRLVVVGLSRGATAALDLGSDLSVSRHMQVGILAMSPPLSRPSKAPATVINIGGFEAIAENFVRLMALGPWWRPFGNWLLRALYVRFTAFVLAELRMDDAAMLAAHARYIASRPARHLCLRAVREFALLGRVSDAELRHAVSGIVQRLSYSEQGRAVVCWGTEDSWVEVEPCRARLEAIREREGLSEAQLSVHLFEGVDHGVGRQVDEDFARLAALLWQLCEHAAAGHQEHQHSARPQATEERR